MEDMERQQFTFYGSFAKAAKRIRKKQERCEFYDAVIDYALFGIEPNMDTLPDTSAIAFELVKPNLDASKRKAKSGKKGGEKEKQNGSKREANAKQTESKAEANRKQTESKKEIEKEKEKEIEKEDECLIRACASASVCADYLNRVNPSASQHSLDELKAYAEIMGEAVCKRAIDIALDSKRATWPYIRAILQNKKEQGVKCLADWDALEQKRKSKTGRASDAPGEAEKRSRDDMAALRELMRRDKEAGNG